MIGISRRIETTNKLKFGRIDFSITIYYCSLKLSWWKNLFISKRDLNPTESQEYQSNIVLSQNKVTLR